MLFLCINTLASVALVTKCFENGVKFIMAFQFGKCLEIRVIVWVSMHRVSLPCQG